jgi:carboxypeptidase C (cathepsin A)
MQVSIVRRLAALATLLAFGLGAAPAKPHAGPIPPATPDAVTHHAVQIDGRAIAYTARAGTIALRNDKEELTARMFYTAYTKDGGGGARPVTFFYNGGPGSSTVWLRMASFGPVRILTANGAPTGPAPFGLANNQYSLLDKSDLVFVDAPNTGYSRVLGAGSPKDFMGVDQDARAFSQFIRRYLSQFDRWNSPKFLFGESYGTTRSAVLVNLLQSEGVQFNGVVLLSSILNFGLRSDPVAGGDWTYVLYLPTEAAAAWYHHKVANRPADLNAFLSEVEGFAGGEYLHALADGANISISERQRIVRKLHDYLGLSEQYVSDSNLRIPYQRFQKELLRNQGIIVGRYDSRFTTYDIDGAAEGPSWDPSDVGIAGVFVGAFNRYVRDDLHYDTNLQYRPTSYGGLLGARWDFKRDGNDPPANVAPDLATAMTQNPHLRVFSANGRYDFATPYFATVYTLRHLNLAPALQNHITFGFYQSGHMVYLNPAALAHFKSDLAHWYDQVLAGR